MIQLVRALKQWCGANAAAEEFTTRAMKGCEAFDVRSIAPDPLALSFAARDFGRQSVEVVGPEAAKAVEPRVDFAQGCGLDGIDPPRSLGARDGEAAVAQDFQMLRDGGLGDAEFFLDRLNEGTGRRLAFR